MIPTRLASTRHSFKDKLVGKKSKQHERLCSKGGAL
jgi:hypothetical protein